jgi:small subunit ribosomal protein S20e
MKLTIFLHSLTAPTEVVKQIIVNIDAGVEVEVTIAA